MTDDPTIPRMQSRRYAAPHIRGGSIGVPLNAGRTVGPVHHLYRSFWLWEDAQLSPRASLPGTGSWLPLQNPYRFDPTSCLTPKWIVGSMRNSISSRISRFPVEKLNSICLLLEAFGNCRTGLNTNATRFTNIFSLDCDQSGLIASASVQVKT